VNVCDDLVLVTCTFFVLKSGLFLQAESILRWKLGNKAMIVCVFSEIEGYGNVQGYAVLFLGKHQFL
jgi:hypothetical protein